MLDINFLYSGPALTERQEQQRLRMTQAVYADKRHELWQAHVWLVVAVGQIFLVIAGGVFSRQFTSEVAQSPIAILTLSCVVACDFIYIACFPGLRDRIQYTLDRLEGKASS